MLDRLLEIGLDRPHGDTDALGDVAMGQILDSGHDQDLPPALGQLGDCASQQGDLRTLLDLALGGGPIVRNIEQAIDLLAGQAAVLCSAMIVGDVQGDPEQIGLGASDRFDIGHAFDAEIGFLQHVRGEIGGSQSARQPLIDAVIVGQQQFAQCPRIIVRHVIAPPGLKLRGKLVIAGYDNVT